MNRNRSTSAIVLAAILVAACGSSEPPPPPPPPPASAVRDQMQPVTAEQVAKYADIFERACLDQLPNFVNSPQILEQAGYKGIDLRNAFDGTSVASVRPGHECFVDFKWQDRAVVYTYVTEMAARSDLTFKPIAGQRVLSSLLPDGRQVLLIGSRANTSEISSFGIKLQ